jgi:hypothetical protein
MRVTVASVWTPGANAELARPVQVGLSGEVLHRRDTCLVVYHASRQQNVAGLNILYILFIRYILR